MPDSGRLSTDGPLCVGQTHRTAGTTLIIVGADNQIRSLQLPARMLQMIFFNTASAPNLAQFRGVGMAPTSQRDQAQRRRRLPCHKLHERRRPGKEIPPSTSTRTATFKHHRHRADYIKDYEAREMVTRPLPAFSVESSEDKL